MGRRLGPGEGERRRQRRAGSRRDAPDGRILDRCPGHGRQRDGVGERLARAIHRRAGRPIRPGPPRAPSRSRRAAGGAATRSSPGPPTATTRIRRPTATSTSASGWPRRARPVSGPATGRHRPTRRVPRPGDPHRVGALGRGLPAVARSPTVSPQPGGTRPGARSASGASTNSRSRGVAMRDLEQPRRLRRIDLGVDRARLRSAARSRAGRGRTRAGRGRARADPSADAADVRTSRSRSLSAARRRERRGRRVRAGRHVQGDDRVAEVGLVRLAPGRRHVQARDAAQPRAGEGRERGDRLGQRRLGIPDVRAEADVRADPSSGHGRLPGDG